MRIIQIGGVDRSASIDDETVDIENRSYAQAAVLHLDVDDPAANIAIALDSEVFVWADLVGGASTTLAAASIIGAVNVKVASVAGMTAGEEIRVGSEVRFIQTVGTAGAGGTGVTLTAALAVAHSSGEAVVEQGREFAGHVRTRKRIPKQAGRTHRLVCHDYNDLLDHDVIDVAFRSVAESDKARITWLVTTFGAKGITAGAEVQQILAQMPPGIDNRPEQDFSAKSLRTALEQIAKLSGGRLYVDFFKRLHHFASEAEAAPFALSDTPNDVTTFAYRDIEIPEESVQQVNAVYVYGDKVKGWRPNPPPAAAIRRAGVIRDVSITSQAQLDAAGDAFLARYDSPAERGSLLCWRSGLRAGQTVQLTNSRWGLNAVSYHVSAVRTWFDAGVPQHRVEFGDPPHDLRDMLSGISRAVGDTHDVAEEAAISLADLSVAGANLVPNSSFESASITGWSVGAGWTFGFDPVGPQEAFAGSKVARLVRAAAAAGPLQTPFVAVDRLDDYWVSYRSFLRSISAGTLRARVRQYNAAQAEVGTPVDFGVPTVAETAWTRYAVHLGPNDQLGRVAFHADTAFIRLELDDATTGTFTWDTDGWQIERGNLLTAYAPAPQELVDSQVGTTQIADDAITTPKVVANAIVAGKIAASAVTTAKLDALAVTADKIAAAAVNAEKVAVGVITGGNLVKNPGAELAGATAGIALGWPGTAAGGGDAPGVWSRHDFGFRSGGWAFSGRQVAGSPVDITAQGDQFIVAGGRKYSVSCWARGWSPTNAASTKGNLRIRWFDKTGALISDAELELTVGTNDSFQMFSATHTAPSTAVSAFLYLAFFAPNTTSDDRIFVDDIDCHLADNQLANTLIDENGVTITNGKLTVSNPAGTVIIDGTSNMFKIVASGTSSTGAIAAGPGFADTFVDVSTGLTYQPAFLAFLQATNGAETMPKIVWQESTGLIFDEWNVRMAVVSSNWTRVTAATKTIRAGGLAAKTYRYYILKEVAF